MSHVGEGDSSSVVSDHPAQPMTTDRDGRTYCPTPGSLTVRDVQSGACLQAPVTDDDADNPDNFNDVVYFFNGTIVKQLILGATGRTDLRGQDETDLTNYALSKKFFIQPGAFYRQSLVNRIWVVTQLVRPQNNGVEGIPTIQIDDPNSKQLVYRMVSGAIHPVVSADESISPNSLKIRKDHQAVHIRVFIFSQNPATIPAGKKQIPVYSNVISSHEHYEYTHVVTERVWNCQYERDVKAAFLNNSTSSLPFSTPAEENATATFRAGTTDWWTTAIVKGGDYVFICKNDQTDGAEFVMIVKQVGEVQILPQRQFQSPW